MALLGDEREQSMTKRTRRTHSAAFTGVLKAHGMAISMDGRGRALDHIFVERLWRSVKYEDL